jgi:hypothetical protein
MLCVPATPSTAGKISVLNSSISLYLSSDALNRGAHLIAILNHADQLAVVHTEHAVGAFMQIGLVMLARRPHADDAGGIDSDQLMSRGVQRDQDDCDKSCESVEIKNRPESVGYEHRADFGAHLRA